MKVFCDSGFGIFFMCLVQARKIIFETFFACRNMYHQWTIELKEMAERIISMRQQLFNALKSRGTVNSLSLGGL